jgi:(E)-4-hydroxy-3-methylbut-2-enyl-diphosphate synthase
VIPKRKKTRKIYVGTVPVGGGSPVSVQSMTKTDTRNVGATVRQVRALQREGCDIVRLAVPDKAAALALGRIKKSVGIPMIADIHFDWRLALEAVKQGVDGLRVNPGNIGAKWKIKEVVSALRERKVPIRIGVNAGSLEKGLLKKYGHPVPEALVESALGHVRLLEDMGYRNIKVSLKASGVLSTVESYRQFSKKRSYPLHIGISEAGPEFSGTVKSSVGLGILLNEGIGDTVRVSLTASPVKEVRVAYEILRSLGVRKRGIDFVSCPTCGRCGVDLQGIATEVEKRLRGRTEPIKVAVMGCVVNGPGEAREADLGIAAGKGTGLVFRNGKVVAKVKEGRLVSTLMKLVEEYK